MNRNLKIISFIFVCSLLFVTGCGKKNNTNSNVNNEKTTTQEVKVNTNENVIKNQVVDGIEMKDTSMITENGVTTFQTTVVNNTGSDYRLNEYSIIVKDQEGNIIKTIPGYIGSTIKNGESKKLKSTTNADMVNAYSVEYQVIK